MNQITIRFSDEDRALLEGLMGSVTLLASVLGSKLPDDARQEIVADLGRGVLNPAAPADHPADAPAAHLEPPAPASDPVPEAPAPAPAPVSLAEFQKALSTRCAEGDTVKQKVHALIRQYAECVSEIPENKRAEVLAALAQI